MTQPSPEPTTPASLLLRSPDLQFEPGVSDDDREPSGAITSPRADYVPQSTATAQYACLVLAPVRPEARRELELLLARVSRETIAAMRGQPHADALVPFQRVSGLHYARFVLLDHGGHGPLLAFATDYDGPEGEPRHPRDAFDRHLSELQQLATGLEQIFACCKAYRARQLAQFVRKHQVPASTFYVGAAGRSCNQIRWEAELATRVKALLAEPDVRGAPAECARRAVLERLRAEGWALPEFPPQPDLAGRYGRALRLAIGGVLLAVLLAAGALTLTLGWKLWAAVAAVVVVLGLLIGGAAARLRWLERHDPQFHPELSSRTHAELQAHAHDENLFFQNQLTHLVCLKPGPLRWLLIRAVFVALQLRATYVYNRGKLGDIPSIHFARWALIPGRGVLFFSNFDSSWQSYLGDFIDKASAGLTAVWSNTLGYPRTRWLLRAGSRDAARFLAWTRHHQQPSQVWYCAYPELSIISINAHTELRRGLARPDSMDAATWLLRAQGVDRVAADRQFSEEQTQAPALQLERIQGIILRGYGHMQEARYLLLRMDPARRAEALAFIGSLPLTSAAQGRRSEQAPEPLLNLAFSARGLAALGVDESLRQRFATAFVQDSDHPQRALINGDVGVDAPEHWAWGAGDKAVHMVLLVYAKSSASADRHAADLETRAAAHGIRCLGRLQGNTLPGRKEHFGFRDGIAQPVVRGCSEGNEANAVPAGEFLLGHVDGYGNITAAPEAANGLRFGHDGSYLVFRQLAQDVEGFWKHCAAQSGDGVAGAVTAAARCVGRWPSGAPLVTHPDADPQDPRYEDEDDFSYLSGDEENDRYGARCPFSAHIRRANPRDWNLGATRQESSQLSALHRIIRRGRPYGDALHPELSPAHMLEAARGDGAPAERGLQFLCFNANIDRQFEFIQQHWCNNPSFAGLHGHPDPVFSSANPLQRFVRVVGSGYFFMPSIPAVQLLAQGWLSREPGPVVERPPAHEQEHIDSLITRLRAKLERDYKDSLMRRDAHPKMHGCVKAKFTVLDVPHELRAGVFQKPQTFQAWVRFSNQSGTISHDKSPDIRGAAIKLLGVAGPKLLDGQEHCHTHDFVLISHDTFVTRDVQEFDGLVGAMVQGKAALLWYALRRPHIRTYLRQNFKRHHSVLDIDYFSSTPYLLGTHVVRYQLRPSSPLPAVTFAGAPLNADYLRDRMRERLERGSVSFDFVVQVARPAAKVDVENPNLRWPAGDTTQHVLARLEIDAQHFDFEERRTFGENLSYNPWRCLPEHRPLGCINRARRQVYRALSLFRHARNAAPQVEPEIES